MAILKLESSIKKSGRIMRRLSVNCHPDFSRIARAALMRVLPAKIIHGLFASSSIVSLQKKKKEVVT